MSSQYSGQLKAIREMPHGAARVAAAEAIARQLEAEGVTERLPEALIDLVEAYVFDDQGAKSFVTFAQLIRLWDNSPELFDFTDRYNLFWEFKWVAADLAQFPQITLAQAEAFLSDMERRYRLEGLGLSSVWAARFKWAWHAGQADMEEARLRWTTGLTDEFDDCTACTIGQQVVYFLDNQRYEEAVQLGLTQQSTCNREPNRTQNALALAALMAGDPELAMKNHRLSLATDGEDRDRAPGMGQRFELLARGGELSRALRVLSNDCAHLLTDETVPLSRLRFLIRVLGGLAANLDSAEQLTGLPVGAPQTVGALHSWVLEQATATARLFDDRNGTNFFSSWIEQAEQAQLSNPALGFEEVRLPAPEPRQSPETVARPPADDLTSAPFAEAERLVSRKDYEAAIGAYLDATERLDLAGWTSQAGLGYAEAAQCGVLLGDDEAAHRYFDAAVSRLRTDDDRDILVEVLAAWAPIAARMRQPQGLVLAAERLLAGELTARDLTPELAARRQFNFERQQAGLRDTLARTIAAAPTTEPTILLQAAEAAVQAGEQFARLGLSRDAAHAFWLAGKVRRTLAQFDEATWALESAFEGFTARRDKANRAAVAEELLLVLKESGQDERAAKFAAEL